jgi:hypothetical protein
VETVGLTFFEVNMEYIPELENAGDVKAKM